MGGQRATGVGKSDVKSEVKLTEASRFCYFQPEGREKWGFDQQVDQQDNAIKRMLSGAAGTLGL